MRVSVMWRDATGQEVYYKGLVSQYNPLSNQHTVNYDDGDVRHYNLARKTFSIIGEDHLYKSPEYVARAALLTNQEPKVSEKSESQKNVSNESESSSVSLVVGQRVYVKLSQTHKFLHREAVIVSIDKKIANVQIDGDADICNKGSVHICLPDDEISPTNLLRLGIAFQISVPLECIVDAALADKDEHDEKMFLAGNWKSLQCPSRDHRLLLNFGHIKCIVDELYDRIPVRELQNKFHEAFGIDWLTTGLPAMFLTRALRQREHYPCVPSVFDDTDRVADVSECSNDVHDDRNTGISTCPETKPAGIDVDYDGNADSVHAHSMGKQECHIATALHLCLWELPIQNFFSDLVLNPLMSVSALWCMKQKVTDSIIESTAGWMHINDMVQNIQSQSCSRDLTSVNFESKSDAQSMNAGINRQQSTLQWSPNEKVLCILDNVAVKILENFINGDDHEFFSFGPEYLALTNQEISGVMIGDGNNNNSPKYAAAHQILSSRDNIVEIACKAARHVFEALEERSTLTASSTCLKSVPRSKIMQRLGIYLALILNLSESEKSADYPLEVCSRNRLLELLDKVIALCQLHRQKNHSHLNDVSWSKYDEWCGTYCSERCPHG
jgi:hypothetical protein